MDRYTYPNERAYREQIAASGNPFLPDSEYGAGLTNLEYVPLAEITGRVHTYFTC
jgi:hypothetical protein